MKQVNSWLWRMVGFIGALAIAIAIAYLAQQEHATGERVERAEAFDPCVTLSQALDDRADAARVKVLTRECRVFLVELGPLIPPKLACAILRRGGYECPKPGSEVTQRKVDVGSGNPPHGQTPPLEGGGSAGSKPPKGHRPASPHHPSHRPAPRHRPARTKPAPPPTAPATQPEASPEPAPAQPGNSGETPAPEHSHGVHACVELAVSACVHTELP